MADRYFLYGETVGQEDVPKSRPPPKKKTFSVSARDSILSAIIISPGTNHSVKNCAWFIDGVLLDSDLAVTVQYSPLQIRRKPFTMKEALSMAGA